MTSREHMPGYAPGLDDNFHDGDALMCARLIYPLGVPSRVKRECQQRARAFVDHVTRDIPPPLDPLTVTHMTPNDVPGVLVAAGAVEVERSLDRIADAGIDPAGAAAAIRGRAVQADEREIVNVVDAFMRHREKRAAQSAVAAADRQRSLEHQQKADQLARDRLNAAAQQATLLHPQAGQVMQGFTTAEQIRNAIAQGRMRYGAGSAPAEKVLGAIGTSPWAFHEHGFDVVRGATEVDPAYLDRRLCSYSQGVTIDQFR